jgi:hypothetical protein
MPLGQMLLGSIGAVAGINTAFFIGGCLVTAIALFAAARVPALRDALAEQRPRMVAGSG